MEPITLADLAERKLSIVAICATCQRRSDQWHPWLLIDRCTARGWSQDIAEQGRHFRCKRCGPMSHVRLELVSTYNPKERILSRSESQKLRRGEPGSGPPGPRQGMGAGWWKVPKR